MIVVGFLFALPIVSYNKIYMSRLKQNIKTVIFGTDTKAGKLFDELLIVTILLSVSIVLLESVSEYQQQYGQIFNYAEWFFTILFTSFIL